MGRELTKLEQMLRDRRPPGAIVRGNGIRVQESNRLLVDPVIESRGRDAGQLERDERRVVEASRRAAEAASRGRRGGRGGVRHIGTMPIRQFAALSKEVGGGQEVMGDERIWKEAGCLFKD